MNCYALLAQIVPYKSGTYLFGRPMPCDPDGKRDPRSVPPKSVANGMGYIVSAGDTPCRALSRNRTQGISEQKFARYAPRICNLNGNWRSLATLFPRCSNSLLAKEPRIGRCRTAINFGESDDVNETGQRCEQCGEYE